MLYRTILNSYSQIFFSDSFLFAAILIAATFIDLYAGIAGLLAVIISAILGISMKFNQLKLEKGLYGFNSLLVGLGLGIYFHPSPEFYLILFLAVIITFFFNIALEGIIGKYGLPFLSIPFIIGIWTITLATRNFEALDISVRGIYTLNDMYILGGQNLVDLYQWWNNLEIFESIRVYFISLGAIFFQYNVLAGILISIGILYYSRIAFSLSLLGFYAAYLFYHILGANLTDVSYTYIGFNYILTSIAIGGFFLIPSFRTYLWTVILVPVVAILTISTSVVFAYLQLSVYSLPFNIIVLLFIYILKFRVDLRKAPYEVKHQQNSPEKNLYSFLNYKRRFGKHKEIPISLPFHGEWNVSQGHEGSITHKDKWKHAWDFVIKDDDKSTFKSDGTSVKDYYCYNKTIVAPASGIIAQIEDGIPDNKIGEVNIKQNWGNTIVIKHADGIYSKLSHLKAGSLEVKKGDSVEKGQMIAKVGSSGRSPEPHLHFQIQETPYIGSETIEYPIAFYIENDNEKNRYKEFDIPLTNEIVSNIKTDNKLIKAFKFIPGQIIKIEYKNEQIEWKVSIDYLNNQYIYCDKTKSFAFFNNNDYLHYFTHFKGDKSSLLYSFFNAAYKIQFGLYEDIKVDDRIPVNVVFGKLNLFFQDFIAPFYLYLKAIYESGYQKNDESIELNSSIKILRFNKLLRQKKYNFIIDKQGIREFSFYKKSERNEVKWIRE